MSETFWASIGVCVFHNLIDNVICISCPYIDTARGQTGTAYVYCVYGCCTSTSKRACCRSGTSSSNSTTYDALSTGAKAGITIGFFCAFVVAFLLIYYCHKRECSRPCGRRTRYVTPTPFVDTSINDVQTENNNAGLQKEPEEVPPPSYSSVMNLPMVQPSAPPIDLPSTK